MLGIQSLGPIAPHRTGEDALWSPAAEPTGESADESTRNLALPEVAPIERSAEAPVRGLAPGVIDERDAWVILLSITGLGPVTFGRLLSAFGSAMAIVETAAGENGPDRLLDGLDAALAGKTGTSATTETAEKAAASGPMAATGPMPMAEQASDNGEGGPVLSASTARRIADAVQAGPATLERLKTLGLEGITLEDPDYPSRLRRVEMPPPLLFVRGSRRCLDEDHVVAVVGTRRPTDKGRLIAGWIAAGLASAGACVVSGLAVGIDGVAHAATLAESGRTVAVLGGGHANLFPKSHQRLAEAIVAAGGAVISEYAPDTVPSRGTFPRRNRLVSGMSDATIVVEAGRRSGALITAGWALEQGRECFLVPGPLDSPASAGCLAFLRAFPSQARVVCGIPELLEDLGFSGGSDEDTRTGPGRRSSPAAEAPSVAPSAVLASLSDLERKLAERLASGPATADELARVTGGSPAAVLSALTLLELRGLVASGYGRYVPAGPLLTAGAGLRRR